MSRMKLALDVVEDLRRLADSIETLTKSITDTNDTDTEDVLEAEAIKEDKPKISLEDIREVLTPLTRAGKREEVKALLDKYGAKKLPDVKEEDYPEFLEEARKI